MNRILGVIAAAVLFAAGTAAAVDAPAKKVTVTSATDPAKDKQGPVSFPHDKHADKKCTSCHADDKGGKIAGLDQKKGHEMCQKCHNDTAKADPAKKPLMACTNCHAKK